MEFEKIINEMSSEDFHSFVCHLYLYVLVSIYVPVCFSVHMCVYVLAYVCAYV